MKLPRFLRQELLQIVLLAAPFVLAARWWNDLPPIVAIRWDLHGQPVGWTEKWVGVLVVPLINVLLAGLLAIWPQVDPRLRHDPATHTARYRRTRRLWRYAVTAFTSLFGLAILAFAAGWSVDIGWLACNGTLVLLAIVGNFLGNLTPNNLLGIRMPLTLEDAAHWRAMHRLIGRILAFGAVGLLAAGWFVPITVQTGLMAGFVVAMMFCSLGYSARFYLRMRRAESAAENLV